MDEFATYGAANWNDTVQMQYPGAYDVAWNEIKDPTAESHASGIKKLVQARDRSFPVRKSGIRRTVPTNPKTYQVAANLPACSFRRSR
jgi:hypothetical protein